MRQQTRSSNEPAEKVVQDIRRATRQHYSAEEKILIVLEGLRGEDSIAEAVSPRGDRQRFVLWRSHPNLDAACVCNFPFGFFYVWRQQR